MSLFPVMLWSLKKLTHFLIKSVRDNNRFSRGPKDDQNDTNTKII